MNSIFKKVYYYRDLSLFFEIISIIIRVSLTPLRKRLELVPDSVTGKVLYDEEKVRRYVTFLFFIMKKLYIRPPCFNNAISVCIIFKKNGIRSKIIFGCNFDENRLKGHCWVETDGDLAGGRYDPIFVYSGERKYFDKNVVTGKDSK